MAAEYEFKGKKFAVSQPDNCAMKVHMGGLEATVSADETSGTYRVTFPNGSSAAGYGDREALNVACNQIIRDLTPQPTKEQLCSRLVILYDKLGN